MKKIISVLCLFFAFYTFVLAQDSEPQVTEDAKKELFSQKTIDSVKTEDTVVEVEPIVEEHPPYNDNQNNKADDSLGYIPLIVACIALLVAIVAVVMHFMADVKVNWEDIEGRPHRITDRLNTIEQRLKSLGSSNYVPSSNVSSNVDNSINQQIAAIQADIFEIKKQLNSNETKPAVPEIPKEPTTVAPPAKVAKKQLYARQNAQEKFALADVNSAFNSYRHNFVITLDTETEGTFELVNDVEIQTRCLKNTNEMLCCEKRGNGTKVIRQEPGRVKVKGNTAEVASPLVVQLGS